VPPQSAPAQGEDRKMLEWIFILLGVAAIAALLGFSRLSGLALSAAQLLILIVLVLFLLMALGVIALA